MHRISLVIFDSDGVLVDSEPISSRVLAQALSNLGIQMSAEESRARFTGLTMEDVENLVASELGKPLPPDWLANFLHARAEVFKTDLREIPGAGETVRMLSQCGFEMCVASQARIEKTLLTLQLTGLLPYFEGRIFSASMVRRPKPFPDLFLHAASEMGHAPESCAVIEDSLPGVRAAGAAGMTVFGYAPNSDGAWALERAGACVFDDIGKLPEILAKLCAVPAS
ncbi:MAG: HAD family hydrolase [Candidatus Acidiferrales bacterium]